ncbi:flagellar basal body-associated FliL family protein [Shimia sp. SDUM112013]|uniref:flagellar basal body-associated FliL family protein n=1 Tax=Shimia sp. SDUM112013 TaxID=3136160 RepID=UPI0032F056A2
MKKFLPIILIVLGLAAGAGAGIYLQPKKSDPEASTEDCQPSATEAERAKDNARPLAPQDVEYAKLNNQFVIPIVQDDSVTSLVVISLTLEVTPGTREGVFAREPKLRDTFLQVMFDHANMGGFEGKFTNSSNLEVLRNALFETARNILGSNIKDVLIMDIVRQEI